MQSIQQHWKLYILVIIGTIGTAVCVALLYLGISSYRSESAPDDQAAIVSPTHSVPVIREAEADNMVLEQQALAEPANPQPLREQARNYVLTNDLERARDLYLQEAEINRNDYLLYKELGDVYVQQGETDNAIDQYLRSIELNAGDNTAYIELANVYQLHKADTAQAEATYKQAIQNNPQLVSFQVFLARFYEQTGKGEQALATYQQVLSLDPENSIAQRKVEQLLGE